MLALHEVAPSFAGAGYLGLEHVWSLPVVVEDLAQRSAIFRPWHKMRDLGQRVDPILLKCFDLGLHAFYNTRCLHSMQCVRVDNYLADTRFLRRSMKASMVVSAPVIVPMVSCLRVRVSMMSSSMVPS